MVKAFLIRVIKSSFKFDRGIESVQIRSYKTWLQRSRYNKHIVLINACLKLEKRLFILHLHQSKSSNTKTTKLWYSTAKGFFFHFLSFFFLIFFHEQKEINEKEQSVCKVEDTQPNHATLDEFESVISLDDRFPHTGQSSTDKLRKLQRLQNIFVL